MLQTECFINGQFLKLKYRKQFEKGDVFKGIILSRSAIPFSFQWLNENIVWFEPESLDEGLKQAIFKAIMEDQSRKKK